MCLGTFDLDFHMFFFVHFFDPISCVAFTMRTTTKYDKQRKKPTQFKKFSNVTWELFFSYKFLISLVILGVICLCTPNAFLAKLIFFCLEFLLFILLSPFKFCFSLEFCVSRYLWMTAVVFYPLRSSSYVYKFICIRLRVICFTQKTCVTGIAILTKRWKNRVEMCAKRLPLPDYYVLI